MSGGPMGWVAALLIMLAVLKVGHVDLRQPAHVLQHSITRQ